MDGVCHSRIYCSQRQVPIWEIQKIYPCPYQLELISIYTALDLSFEAQTTRLGTHSSGRTCKTHKQVTFTIYNTQYQILKRTASFWSSLCLCHIEASAESHLEIEGSAAEHRKLNNVGR